MLKKTWIIFLTISLIPLHLISAQETESFQENGTSASFQLSFISPAAIPWHTEHIDGFRFNLIYGANTTVIGLDMGLIQHTTKIGDGFQFGGINMASKMVGPQFGIVCNSSQTMHGPQLSLGFNVADIMNGLQLGSLFNIAKSIDGPQAALGMNIAGNMDGVQICPFINISENIDGPQLAIICNMAKQVHGIQLGLINTTRHAGQKQIGIINIANKNSDSQFGLLNFGNGRFCPFYNW